jgi:hypothetical protein
VSKREKLLAGAVVVLIALFGARYLYGRYDRALSQRGSELSAAQDELATAKMQLTQGQRAVQQMEGWHERSLPANREKALSLYKAWLLAKASKAGLAVDDISPTIARRTANLSSIGYQIKATGNLASVIAMLYEFYNSQILHQVGQLQLMRPPGSTQLQVTFQAEALILPGANATDSLPEGESKRLKLESLAEYQKSLGGRELVAVYTPPRPVETVKAAPKPPEFDDAEQAYFSGAVSNGNGMQAWINVRTTGETLHLSAGDPVKVGALEGQIVSIEPRFLVWQSGDKKFRVPLGESLRKGKELAADGTAVARPEAERPES